MKIWPTGWSASSSSNFDFSTMTVNEVLHDIEKGDISPFYFLYGVESFYRVEIVRALTRQLITPDNQDFNLEHFEARETALGEWLGAARTISFMGGG